MTTLREELDWIARPFSLAPPMPEEIFTECVDNLSLVIKEADMGSNLGSGDEPNFEQSEEAGDGEEKSAPSYNPWSQIGGNYQEPKGSKAKKALEQFITWLSAMREQFPNAGKKLGALQAQVRDEIDKRPDKMLQAIAAWGKDKMLPQFAKRIKRTAGDYEAMRSYYDKLEEIIGV